MDVETELDRRARKATISSSGPAQGRHCAMKNHLFHKVGELTSSPAPFHAIYALQRTAPAVTLAAHSATAFPPAAQPARQPPQSLSLGS